MSEAEDKKQKILFKLKNPISSDLAIKATELINLDLSDYVKIFTNTKLDKILIEGFNPRSINIFAGRTGSGKSLALLHLAYRFAVNNDKVCYVSFENDIYTDAERLKEVSKTYIERGNFDYFNYFALEAGGYGLDKANLIETFKEYKYVFLDAYQLVCDDLSDGASMHAAGNVLMKELHKLTLANDITFFLTWQLTRGAPNDIKEIEVDDMSFSMGVSRYATTVWAIAKTIREEDDKLFWNIRLVKSRAKYDDKKTIISIYSRNNDCISLTADEELA